MNHRSNPRSVNYKLIVAKLNHSSQLNGSNKLRRYLRFIGSLGVYVIEKFSDEVIPKGVEIGSKSSQDLRIRR